MDQADRHLPLPAGRTGFVDVHGGWYDATGDYGIHLSHQNPTSYFNPQQVPLVAWSLLKTYRVLEARQDDNFSEYLRRLLDEGLFGADFLVRVKRPGGSFFESITAPGKDKLPQDRAIGNPNWRTQIKKSSSDSTEHIQSAEGPHAYEASFRAGGGMAIAALPSRAPCRLTETCLALLIFVPPRKRFNFSMRTIWSYSTTARKISSMTTAR
jgi:hypothetical protein